MCIYSQTWNSTCSIKWETPKPYNTGDHLFCEKQGLCYMYNVNDLTTVVRHSELNIYADDTEPHLIRLDLFSVQHGFQCDLNTIQAWLCVSRLQFNVSKSVVMLIGTRQKINHCNVTTRISGQILIRVPYTKQLFRCIY